MSDEKRPGGAPVDEPPTAEEEAAAATLRRALEDGEAAGPAQVEAEAAALLGFSRDAGALAPDRAEAVLRRVLESSSAPVRRPARRTRWRWLVPAAAKVASARLARARARWRSMALLRPMAWSQYQRLVPW
jgi:hypothetical protein